MSPGASFTAETLDPQLSDVDTVLGWFDSAGTFLAEDDDGGEGVLSKLTGAVPNDGALTFAVTGFGDDDYVGSHSESGSYQLQLTIAGGVTGDFNGDSQVNAQDLTVWSQNFSASSSAADADGDGDSDGQDLLLWQQNLGEGVPATAAAQAAPEPGGLVLWAVALAGWPLLKARRGSI